MNRVGWGVSLLVVLSCGGVSTSVPDDGGVTNAGGGGGTTSTPTGKGGAVGKGGKGGTTGSVGMPGRGGTFGKGGSPGKGGTAGRGGTTSRGGTTGKGGVAGTGGEPPGGEGPGGDGPIGGAGGDCLTFTQIGVSRRCEDAGSRVQDQLSERVVGATSLGQCANACMARSDCTAITDYFSEQGLDACSIRHGGCGTAGPTVWAEEDAGKEYRKICNLSGQCRLEYLGDFVRCDESSTVESIPGATSRADCDAACLASPTCSSVIDYFWIGTIRGCYLYTGTCDHPEALPFGDPGVTYRKVCD